MSTQGDHIYSGRDIVSFYTGQLNNHGDTSKGVGWKNDEAQLVRFEQLLKVIVCREGFSLNDLGCGTGKFFDFLCSRGFHPSAYRGYDILPDMIRTAQSRLQGGSGIQLSVVQSADEMTLSDYSVASGIFNVKYDAPEFEWMHYVLSTIDQLNTRSAKGFAFNLLTKYSDAEFMQSYLFYADPLYFFDYCKRNFSKNVALLHDYDQYDFTIIVRKK